MSAASAAGAAGATGVASLTDCRLAHCSTLLENCAVLDGFEYAVHHHGGHHSQPCL